MTSSTEEVAIDDGLVLLTRHWSNDDPAATMVLVHGAADHSGRWEHVGEFFAEAGFDVHAYDMRGHGRSGGHPMFVESFTEFLDDLETMLDRSRRNDRPTVVYAHSLGGLVATTYGVSSRPQPDLYVMSAPALGSTTPKVLRAVAYVLGGVIPKLAAPTAIKMEQLSRDPAVGDSYLADPHVHGKSSLRLGKEAFRTMAETKALLENLTTPTLVIHGADDELVPPAVSAPLAALPSTDRKVFAGMRHELHNETEADEVLSFVAEWLRAQLSPAAT